MNIGIIYDKLASLSPYIELAIRNLYWNNVKKLKQLRKGVSITNFQNLKNFNFDQILNFLKEENANEHEIVIIHSSYDALMGCGLKPNEILAKLLDFFGPDVTIAMPVIRKFKGEPSYEDLLTADTSEFVRTYDVQRTAVSSGIIPYMLMRKKEAVTSRFPLNPLTAIGPLAADMMKGNIDGNYPSAHGIHSSWNYCLYRDTIIIHLGVDASHHMTIIHATEETTNWPIPDNKWYNKRKFIIKDGDFECKKIINERKEKWGLLHIAEKYQSKLMHQAGIIHEKKIGGVLVSVTSAKDISTLFYELRKKYPTFPYFKCN